MDDIMVANTYTEEHLRTLEEVFREWLRISLNGQWRVHAFKQQILRVSYIK